MDYLTFVMSKQIGYQDTMRGIKTFPTQGTDKFKTVQDFCAAMTEAAAKCKDKNYAKGVLAAINEFKS